MIYGSVCSGIEAATAAWHPLGWSAAFFSEIEAFPRAVLAHHYPGVPLHGDFTTIQAGNYEPIDLLVGGTPCQSFSVAGLRGGLADERGNLALEYLRLADRLRPRWLVWENVPGVLSSGGGRDFGSFLGGLVKLGYGFAYRVLDAQFFGLAQRRKRVFVVGYLGDWRRAAAVLFEPASLRGHPAPRRTSGEVAARCLANGTGSVGGQRYDGESEDFVVAETLRDHPRPGSNSIGATVVAPPLTHNPYGDHESREGLLVAFDCKAGGNTGFAIGDQVGAPRGDGNGGGHAAIACATGEITHALTTGATGGMTTEDGTGRGAPLLGQGAAVRRLTPRECERLQGFPDDFTLIPYRSKPAADGPRYRALGNSMAVPCMAWIGRRVDAQEADIQALARVAA